MGGSGGEPAPKRKDGPMRTAPAGLAATTVAAEAAKGWGVPVSRLRYVALGGASYHWFAAASDGGRYFLTVGDLRAKPWPAPAPSTTFAGFVPAFAAPAAPL